ncbi:MAG TPA: hypothetical protein VGX23_21520 [Actinocrinis sp.]|nr:hypothetical protein [Actinocrinis sp.]
MLLSRRASWLLLAFAAWSWFIWVTLVKNISADPRAWGPGHHPTAFLGVHVVLAIISLVFGTAIGRLGWRGLQAARRPARELRVLRPRGRARPRPVPTSLPPRLPSRLHRPPSPSRPGSPPPSSPPPGSPRRVVGHCAA